MRLELTPEQVKVLEIALSEMFNSDTWISGRSEEEIDRIAERAQYLLKTIVDNQHKSPIRNH